MAKARSRRARERETISIAAVTRRKGREEQQREQALMEANRITDNAWARRHPQLAAEERALCLARHERQMQFAHSVNATSETLAHARIVREGALARLYHSGSLTIEQWGASLEIAAAHARVVLDAGLPSSWAIERVDHRPDPEKRFQEALGTVRLEMTYSRWRREIEAAGAVLAIIVEDCGLVAAARRHSMGEKRLRRLLVDALERWMALRRSIRDEVDEATIEAARAAIL